MENKYYTPKPEEVNIKPGDTVLLEYCNGAEELVVSTIVHDMRGYDPFIFCGNDKEVCRVTDIRVKYLDREDIESLGFNLVETEPHDLYSREVDKDHTWLLVPHYFEEGCELRVWIVSKSSVIKGGEFDGTIKNKSELKMVLKMIGYEE